jgi:hypothetical protein
VLDAATQSPTSEISPTRDIPIRGIATSTSKPDHNDRGDRTREASAPSARSGAGVSTSERGTGRDRGARRLPERRPIGMTTAHRGAGRACSVTLNRRRRSAEGAIPFGSDARRTLRRDLSEEKEMPAFERVSRRPLVWVVAPLVVAIGVAIALSSGGGSGSGGGYLASRLSPRQSPRQ